MSLTTIVGAFLAVAGRPKQERPKQELEIEALRRSHTRLADHIERLERELAMAQQVLEHWRDEAARLARENRERREYRNQAQACAQAQQVQQNVAMAQYAMAHLHAMQDGRYLGAQGLLAGHAQQMQTFDGFCNCVPSRAQVWGAQHGLVQQLNDNGRT